MKPSWHWSNSPNREDIIKRIADKKRGVPMPGNGGHANRLKGKKLPWAKKAAEARRASGMYERVLRGNKFATGKVPWNKDKKGVMPTPWNKGTHGKMPTPTNKGQGVGASVGLAIRGLPEYISWRTKVFKRDGYKCIWCGEKKNLHVDHIKAFALICRENGVDSTSSAIKCKELWRVKNGRTLCPECHRSTETYAGKLQTQLYKFPRS